MDGFEGGFREDLGRICVGRYVTMWLCLCLWLCLKATLLTASKALWLVD